MNWILTFSLLVGCVLTSEAALRDVIGICCDMGRQYSTQGECSDLEYFPFLDIQEPDRSACIKLATGCCNHELQISLCVSGIDQRADLGSCTAIEGDDCYSVEKHCCGCCELGLEAYHAGAPCEITTLGEMCNEAFQRCCQRAFNEGDVDECVIFGEYSSAGVRCDQLCTNTIGDYVCECGPDMVLSADGFTCTSSPPPVDPRPTRLAEPDPYRDPCDTAPCTQQCRSNTVTYQCYCDGGYLLNDDQASCRDEDECVTGYYRCNTNERCVNTEGGYQCQIDVQCSEPGYEYNQQTRRCEEIVRPTVAPDRPRDPCDTAPCTQECRSNTATYQCYCHSGYLLNNDQITCRAIVGPAVAPDRRRDPCDTAPCTQECRSNTATYQCYCHSGFLLNNDQTSCSDENECETGYYHCNNNEGCVNTEGGYTCQPGAQCTEPGYEYDQQTRGCVDINECASGPEICEPHQECINYAGHYYCNAMCNQGFQVVTDERRGRHTCIDIDECAAGSHNCAIGQRCDNLEGSFRCTRTVPCGTGYTINASTQECEDVDECAQNVHDCSEHYVCNNTLGSYRCDLCPPGYRVGPSNICSIDINECDDPNICQHGYRCDNTYGSYRCSSLCPKGFEYVGYLGQCIDIDECARGQSTCHANQVCKNTVGLFSCQCKEGFTYDFATETCNDIDECAEGERIGRPKCRPHERCDNNGGSHRCMPACPFGQKYTVNGLTWNCTDINECRLGQHNCRGDEICINDAYNGTYRCIRCTRGTVLNARAKTCDDIDECNSPKGRVCLGTCHNNPGSFYCTCPTGYNMLQNRICSDVDECQVGNHRCGHGQLCFNTKGTHRCLNIQCPNHYNKRVIGRQVRCDKIKRELCPPAHLDRENCATNRTSPIIYFPLALRSYNELSERQNVLTLRIQAPLHAIDFRLSYGNKHGYFGVLKHRRAETEGILQLIKPVEGPYQTELHMDILTIDRHTRPGTVISHVSSKAIIMVDVSPFDF